MKLITDTFVCYSFTPTGGLHSLLIIKATALVVGFLYALSIDYNVHPPENIMNLLRLTDPSSNMGLIDFLSRMLSAPAF